MKTEDITLVVTRPLEQAKGFLARAKQLGFRTLALPTVRIETLPLSEEIQKVIVALDSGQFDWIIFTSSNAVSAFSEAQKEALGRMVLPLNTKAAVQGSRTKAALIESFGREPHIMPEDFVLEELAKAFQGLDMKGREVLFPISKKHRTVLIDALRELGAKVTLLPLYDAINAKLDEHVTLELKKLDPRSVIFTFFSPSAFEALIDEVGEGVLNGAKIATIGPVTSLAVRAHGFEVFVEAREHTEEGLARSLYETVLKG